MDQRVLLPRQRNIVQHPKNEAPVQRPRKELQALRRTLLEAISCKDHNSPIHLVDNNCLKYKYITELMNIKWNVLTVNADVARRLAMEEGNVMQGKVNVGNQVQVNVLLGDSFYIAVQSAISFPFQESGGE